MRALPLAQRLLLVSILLNIQGPLRADEAEPIDFSELTNFLRQNMAPVLPGGFTLTLARDGAVLYEFTSGGVGPRRAVAAASASKWYTAAVVLALADDGALSLEDPAGKYLPKFSGEQAQATIAQMLSHTSGLQGGEACIGTKTLTLGECVDLMAGTPLQFAPGTAFAYGAASINAAGRIAEIAGGKSWDALFAEKIAGPLEMTCTTFGGGAEASYPILSGGVVTCAEDYTRFLEMIADRGVYRGRRVLSATAVAEMQRPRSVGLRLRESPYSPFFRQEPALASWSYGAGEWVERRSAAQEPLEVSSQGALSFSPWVDLERDLTGVLAAQDGWNAVVPAYLRMKELIRRLVPAPAVSHIGVKNAASERTTALAPGLLVSIAGRGLGPEEQVVAESPELPLELGGTRVLVDGAPVRLLSVSGGLIRAVMPDELPEAAVRLEVERDGAGVAALTMPVDEAAPALIRGAVENEDGTWNNPLNPARPGSTITVYGTGAAGAFRPEFSIGGQAAEVVEAGPALEQSPGIFRVVARVPDDIAPSATAALELRLGRARSQTGVSCAVGEPAAAVFPVVPR